MFSDPQFWVAVAFVAFIIAIFNPVRKILTSNLDTPIKQIKDSIEEAENLKNETQVTLSEIKQRQKDVQVEIKSIHDEAKNKVKQLELNAEQRLKEQIEKKKILANAKIDQLTRDANSSIKTHITSTAIEATISLLQKKINDQEKQKMIDRSINELSSVLKN
mgnify:CR=1 FL=1